MSSRHHEQTPSQITESSRQHRERFGRRGFAVATVAAIGLAALTGCAPHAAADTHATKAPTPTPVATEAPLSVDSLLIPTTLTPDQVATKFFADWDAALNANETAAFNKKAVLAPETLNASASDQATKDIQIFTDAVMESNYESSPTLENWKDGMTITHAGVLTDWLATYQSGNAADYQPYHTWTTIDGVTTVAKSADSLELKVTTTDHNNGADNTVGANATDGSRYGADVTFVNEGGDWKASDIEVTKTQ